MTLHKADCRRRMKKWDEYSQQKQEEIIGQEENIIFDCLATFGKRIPAWLLNYSIDKTLS
jgi:hypothetical protein